MNLVAILRKEMGPESFRPDTAVYVLSAVRLLAGGISVDPKSVQNVLGWASDRTLDVCEYLLAHNEIEYDENGRLSAVAGLSLTPTSHQFNVEGHALYAWCAIDTLFFPKLLGQRADVQSVCPISREEIRLSVSPVHGIERCQPETAFVSVVIPGKDRSRNGSTCAESGPELYGVNGAFCGNVFFFRSETEASVWRSDHADAIVLPVKEAHDLAVQVWADPLLKQADRAN